MTEKTFTLTIEKLAGLGDGVGEFEGRRIFVPYTLPGDVVRARIVHATSEAVHALPEEIMTPSPERIAPVCRHFADCGGCALQHMNEGAYVDFKQQMAREAVRKAGFDPGLVAPLLRMPAASRRRVEVKMEGAKLGYYAERSHRLVDIEECKVLEPALEAFVLGLKPAFKDQNAYIALQINSVDGGYDLLLHLRHGVRADFQVPEWAKDPRIVRVSIKSERGMRKLHQAAPVTLALEGIKVNPPPGAFMQASKEAQAAMTNYVVKSVGGAGRVLDLFAGLGTYSFPLARKAAVTAMESDAPMVRAMQDAARENGVANFKTEVRDLFRAPVAASDLGGFDAVVINPPRTGAKEQSEALAASKVKKLVMVSCNPATFARDARLLKEGGFTLQNALPIDQFIYSSHLEILANFVK